MLPYSLAKKNQVKKVVLLITAMILVFMASAQTHKTAQRLIHYNLSAKNLALEGYDPVSYFSGKPVKGRAEYAVQHEGVMYRFANAAHKEVFLKSPSVYKPQYGGWCAYAMGSNGTKISVDPQTFKIVNGKLYLFYHIFFNNTLTSWNKNEAVLMKAADVSWNGFFH